MISSVLCNRIDRCIEQKLQSRVKDQLSSSTEDRDCELTLAVINSSQQTTKHR